MVAKPVVELYITSNSAFHMFVSVKGLRVAVYDAEAFILAAEWL